MAIVHAMSASTLFQKSSNPAQTGSHPFVYVHVYECKCVGLTMMVDK